MQIQDIIQSLRRSNPDRDANLAVEINKLAYELYGLGEEDIKVVEGR